MAIKKNILKIIEIGEPTDLQEYKLMDDTTMMICRMIDVEKEIHEEYDEKWHKQDNSHLLNDSGWVSVLKYLLDCSACEWRLERKYKLLNSVFKGLEIVKKKQINKTVLMNLREIEVYANNQLYEI